MSTTAVRCPACATEAPTSTARWCGACGDPLQPRRDRDRPPPGVVAVPVTDDPVAVTTGATATPISRRGRLAAGLATLAMLAGLLVVQAGREAPEVAKGHTARGDRARSGVIATRTLTAPTATAWRVPTTLPDLRAPLTEVYPGHDVVYVVDVGGVAGVTAHDADSGALRWARRDLTVADGPRVHVGDRLFVTLRDGRGVALDAEGEIRWTTAEREILSPRAANGLLLQRRDTVLEARAPDTGEILWERDLARDAIGPERLLPTAPAGRVAVIGNRPLGIPLGARPELEAPQVLLLDAATGAPRVRIDLPAGLAWFQQPVAVGTRLVAAADVTHLLLWDGRTGEGLTRVAHGLGDRPLEVEVSDGLALLRSSDEVVAFDGDGARVWRRAITPPVDVEPRGDMVALLGPARTTFVDAATGQVRGGQPVAETRRVGPLAADGTAYTLDHEGTLAAYGSAGNRRWQAATTVPPAAAPAVAEDMVAVATGSGVLALRLTDGSRKWEHRTSSGDRGLAGELQTPVIVDGSVVVSPPLSAERDAGGLYALDRTTGILRWSRLTDVPAPRGPLTLDRDLVLVPVADELHGHSPQSGRRAFAARAGGHRGPIAAGDATLVTATPRTLLLPSRPVFVVGVRRADRVLRWRTQLPACSPPVVAGDLAVVATTDAVVALDLSTGDAVWRAPARPSCTELATAGGLVVTTTRDHGVLALDLVDGAQRWRTTLEQAPAVAPVLAGDEILIARLDGILEARALDSGDERWRVRLAGVPATAPVAAQGTMVVLLRDGSLQALR